MTKNFKLVTVFCEAVLEPLIIKELDELGITGYTVSDCRGRGTHGVRSGRWSASANIRVEVMCELDLSHRVAEVLNAKYDQNYGLLIVSSTVDVLN